MTILSYLTDFIDEDIAFLYNYNRLGSDVMKVLFVEDDEAIALGLVYSLEKDGYKVVHCLSKQEAMEKLSSTTFDLLLLDISLPDGTGYEICHRAKEKSDVPVIFLTAMDDEVNIVMGLDMGGDDYITKPFRVKELLSRIKSVLRRYQKGNSDNIIKIHQIEIYLNEGKVYKEGKEVLLTALEYRLLMVFVNHQGQVLSRSQLLEGIWDVAGDFVNDNTLSVYIKRLREKLEIEPSEPNVILTVRGRGYRMEKSS